MARPFRFAVQAMDLGDHDAVVSAARQAEDLGYEELWSYDHLGTVDPFVPLVLAAEATRSLRVGPLVLNNELHHPALLARTAATVDRISSGRLVLGFGTGYQRSEHEAMGIGFAPPPARVNRLKESLIAVRSLLDSGSVEMNGEYHRLDIAELGIRPAQARVPFLVGGYGRRVIALGAELADIFQFTGMSHAADGTPQPNGLDVASVAVRGSWLSQAAGERDQGIERSVLVQRCVIGDDARTAVDQAASRLGTTREVVEETPFLLMGSVTQMIDKIESLRARLGVSHFVVREAADFAPVVAALAGR